MAASTPNASQRAACSRAVRLVEISELNDVPLRKIGSGGAVGARGVRIYRLHVPLPLAVVGAEVHEAVRAEHVDHTAMPANRRSQLARIVSNTGAASATELADHASTSADARCCSRASLVSLNSRTFSMAITAWSRTTPPARSPFR